MATNGEILREHAERLGIPRRTREQVETAYYRCKTPLDRAAFVRLTLNHGRLTEDARAFLNERAVR